MAPTSTVLVFDLDDTLYDESTYVESGFRAVAAHLAERYGGSAPGLLRQMRATLAKEGRGEVFDRALDVLGARSDRAVRECVRVYRSHSPRIRLYAGAARVLKRYASMPLYVVTDGNKHVQARKVAALGLEPLVRRVFITRRFGIENEKPSLHCFELIRRAEKRSWSDLVYVGDNPAKDFVSLNRVGARTIRVRTGAHRAVRARPGYDALVSIAHVGELDIDTRS